MSSPAICLAADCGQLEPWQAVLVVVGAFAMRSATNPSTRASKPAPGRGRSLVPSRLNATE